MERASGDGLRRRARKRDQSDGEGREGGRRQEVSPLLPLLLCACQSPFIPLVVSATASPLLVRSPLHHQRLGVRGWRTLPRTVWNGLEGSSREGRDERLAVRGGEGRGGEKRPRESADSHGFYTRRPPPPPPLLFHSTRCRPPLRLSLHRAESVERTRLCASGRRRSVGRRLR